jgi:hypothetical protein
VPASEVSAVQASLKGLKPIGDVTQLNQLVGTGLANWGKLYEEYLGFVATAAQIHMYTGDLTRLDQVANETRRNP